MTVIIKSVAIYAKFHLFYKKMRNEICACFKIILNSPINNNILPF